MKLSDIGTVLGGAFVSAFSWHVYTAGRVIGRGAPSLMTRESHPLLFWLEVLAFALVGLLLLTYGLAGVFGFRRLTEFLDAAVGRVSLLKIQIWTALVALALFLGAIAWLVYGELAGVSSTGSSTPHADMKSASLGRPSLQAADKL